MVHSYNKINKRKTYFVLLCVFSILASLFSELNTSVKVIPIAIVYVILYLCYRRYRKEVKLNGLGKTLFYAFVVYSIFLILRSVFWDSNNGLMGNYVLSLFGNLELGVLSWALPAVFLFTYEDNILLSYKKVCDFAVLLGMFAGCLYLAGIEHSLYCKLFYLVPVVCPRLLVCNRKKYFYGLYFAVSLYYCYTEDERSVFGMEAICLAGLIFFMFFKHKGRILKMVKLYTCIVPIVGVTLTTVNLVTSDSIFTILEDKYSNKSTMVQDSRTFLFRELNEDLTHTSSWLYGKGIFGTYYSQVMHNARMRNLKADNENRLGTECGHLWLLLKGGIILMVLYVALFYIAILRGNDSDHVWLMFLSFIMANRLLIMFVSFPPSFDLSNILTWLFLSFCLRGESSLNIERQNQTQ